MGPRPCLARELQDMGGFWQVSARSTVSFAERLEIEARYVRNWSVWPDAILLVQTPLVVVPGGRGGEVGGVGRPRIV